MENEQNKKYWFFGSKLNTVLLLVLIILMVVAIRIMLQNKETYLPVLENESNTTQNLKDTYTYTNHGFSIELPKGYVPTENASEGGPAIGISLPQGGLAYVTDATWWEQYGHQDFQYLKDEKIGSYTFKVFNYSGKTFYWLKQGNVGYEFSGIDINILKSFKFVGWPQVEGRKDDLVSFSISPGQEVSGKVHATGSVKGGYFFEANIVINILDANKNKTHYGPGHANATTDWTTAGPVSFALDFDFSIMPKGPAYIEIHNDNASGLPQNDKSILVPIVIK